ncbi:hypothetical protein MHZ92_20070 [Sporosarcina sp. ACRSL]|uniref:hypothetical protein n=1 Tax=Sporosarcina sp. ACRSL TaxID=2918215 RepID=UPI001EF68282|nr:hypothetical protein [Sporosarcina sp. ACRSL]MCG7346406.1 hypothetical protein [Sporosarcina sp. ACRSL]
MQWLRKKKIEVEVERKERSDKKVQVAPYVPIQLKREIERLAFILDQPVKTTGELLCHYGFKTHDVTHRFGDYMQTGILLVGSTMHYGHDMKPSLRELPEHVETERIHLRFIREEYDDNIKLLASLLDVSPTRATAVLLDFSIRHHGIIEEMLQKHTNRLGLGYEEDEEMRKLMRFINHRNPYKTSWNQILVQLVEGFSKRARGLGKRIPDKAVDRETYRWTLDDFDEFELAEDDSD